MSKIQDYYVSWLGKLTYAPLTDSWRLDETEYLRSSSVYYGGDGRLRFLDIPLTSPLRIVMPGPHKTELKYSLKDPFQSLQRPIRLAFSGWAWSPLLGWCYIKRNATRADNSIWVPAVGVRVTESLWEKPIFPREAMTDVWWHKPAEEFLQKVPLFSGPQTFILTSLHQKWIPQEITTSLGLGS